jgi:hypothetical protein
MVSEQVRGYLFCLMKMTSQLQIVNLKLDVIKYIREVSVLAFKRR